MPSLGELSVLVGAKIDGFEKSMGTVSQRLNAIDKQATGAFSGFAKLGDRLSTIGTAVTGAVTLPLAAAGGAATKFAADFEEQMRKVTSLLGGATQKEFEELNKDVLALSRSMGVDAVNSAEALYEVISAGVPKENAVGFLEQASKTAIAGATSTKVAVDSLTTIIAAYGLQVSDANKVSDAMFQAVNVGKFQFDDLAKSIGPAAAQANNLGISYEELLAATSTLSITSGGVSIAVTQIESAMRALLDRTPQMDKALEAIGFKTAKAAIASLGFEGTLEALRKTTGGSAEAFNALFGRIEGASAALGLTGPKAAQAAKDYETLKAASNGLGATQTALEERNKSFNRQLEILTANAKATAIEFGTALLPAAKNLLESSKPLIDVAGQLVKWFTELPSGAQTVAIAFAAAAAAVGPLILGVGSLIEAMAAITPAVTSLTGAIGVAGGAGLTGVLAIAGPLAIAFGAAIAGWAIFKAVSEVQRLNTELNRLEETLPKGKKANEEQAQQIKVLESVIAQHNKQVGAQQIVVSSAGKSVEEYIKALQDAIKENKVAVFAYEKTGAAIKKTGEQHGDAAKGAEDLKKAVERTEAAYKNALRAYDQGKISLEKLGQAQEAFIRAQDAADPERAAKRHETAYFAMLDRGKETFDGLIKFSQDYEKVSDGLAESITNLSIDYAKAQERIRKESQQTIEIVVPLNKRLPEGIQAAIKETGRVADAYKQLGVTAPGELAKTVEANRKAYETIAKDSGKNSVAALEAWIKYEESRQEAARRSGEVIPEQQRKELEKAQAQLDAALGKQVGSWGKLTQQVSTIINDFAKDLAAGTVNLLKGLFGFDDFNDKLDADTAKLNEELAERTESIEAYQQDIATKIANVQSGYAAQLEQETAELRASLAERTAEYEQYSQDVATQLEALRNEEGERLAGELATLANALRDKEAAYQEYQSEVASKEQEIRDSHAERLAEQLDDLRDNLRDRQQSYEDFVKDANRSLSEIGADLSESISDATRGINRRIEDENEDFADDQEKLRDEIAKAERKGETERSNELRKQLDRRTKDHEKSVRRLKEDLEEQVSDAQRAAERETAHLREQLERRARDHREFVAENKAKQDEAVQENRESLNKQLGDLQENLNKRTKELLKFRDETKLKQDEAAENSKQRLAKETSDLQSSLNERKQKLDTYAQEVETKIESLTTKYTQEQAKEVAALNLELSNKLKEYDAYKLGVDQKLKDLEAAHKGPLDRIRDMFTGVFEAAGNAILRLIGEEFMGKLVSSLGNLISKVFPSLGSAIAGVFNTAATGVAGGVAGAAGGVAGGVGSAAGGIASGVAGVASGLAGTLSAVGALGSFAAGIVTAIGTMRLEGTMNAVEENTRFTAIGTIGTGGIVDTLREYQPELLNIRGLMAQFLDQHAWRVHDIWEQIKKTNDLLRGGALGTGDGSESDSPTVSIAGDSVADLMRGLSSIATIQARIVEFQNSRVAPWMSETLTALNGGIMMRLAAIHDVVAVSVVDTLKGIRDAVSLPGPHLATETAAGGVTVNIINPTFRDRSDIDYAVQQVSRNFR